MQELRRISAVRRRREVQSGAGIKRDRRLKRNIRDNQQIFPTLCRACWQHSVYRWRRTKTLGETSETERIGLHVSIGDSCRGRRGGWSPLDNFDWSAAPILIPIFFCIYTCESVQPCQNRSDGRSRKWFIFVLNRHNLFINNILPLISGNFLSDGMGD